MWMLEKEVVVKVLVWMFQNFSEDRVLLYRY